MKGVVIDFSIQKNGGLISGDDGNRYTFTGAEWRDNTAPMRGMRVDFDTDGSNVALAVYQEIITKPQKAEQPTFQKNTKKFSPKIQATPKEIVQDEYIDESDYTFIDWYKKVLINYVNFEGRARRKEYWFFVLVNFMVGLSLGIVSPFIDELAVALYWLYTLATFLPALGVSIRRLHDTGRSGWYCLVGLIPVIGSFILLFWFATEGDDHENDYGYPPK